MDKLILKAEPRKLTGKKVKKLRREGIIPFNLYGREMKSQTLQTDLKEFQQIYKQAKSTQVVYLNIGKNEFPALILNIQRHPTKPVILHADFKKVDLKQKTEVEVPIEVIGELEVLKSGEADLLILLDKVQVECLPTKIPEKITIDISKFKGIGTEVRIKDLAKSPDYEYKDESDQLVLQIAEAKKEEIAPPTPAETEVVPEGEEGKEGEEKKTEGESKEDTAETKKEGTPDKKQEPKV